MTGPYQEAILSTKQELQIRGLRYAVHAWGDPRAVPILLLHGWMDTGKSFQFLADHLAGGCHLIAPDWRGCGDSGWNDGPYWFPDYYADLDALIRHYSPSAPVMLVLGRDSIFHEQYLAGAREEILACLPHLQEYTFRETGHMLHWERPGELAGVLADFLNLHQKN